METINKAIGKEKLTGELKSQMFLRETRRGNMEIYVFNYNEASNLMLEVARLREVSFRNAGGGTGKSFDLDHYDVGSNPYSQLIVWNPREQEIVGGYRFAFCKDHIRMHASRPELSMADYFLFSDKFKKKYLTRSVELGRAWIQPAYQATANKVRYIYALDNLWDGLGGLINKHRNIDILYGKITLFPNYNPEALKILYWFLYFYFPDPDKLLIPIRKTRDQETIDFAEYGFTGENYKSDLKLLPKVLRTKGEVIPPLVSAYLNLTHRIKIFGTVFCPDFGNTYETGIMLRIKDIEAEKLKRYTGDYCKERVWA